MTFEVEQADAGGRLDVYLAGRLPELSRSRIKRLIAEGAALVDGQHVKAGLALKAGMRIEVRVPPLEAATPRPEDIPLDVVFEDEWLIVVNKPAGMVVHPAAGSPDGTLVNALLAHCADLSGVGGVERPGIVHRLDKGTSGLLVVAKNDAAHRSLTEQLSTRTMKREYLAIVCGNVEPDADTIDAPIGRSQRDRKKMAVDPQRGRTAVTHYEVLHRAARLAVVRCRLETGRTHQIRVHFASRNWPVVGDETYGPGLRNIIAAIPAAYSQLRPELAKIKRQLLHAEKLTFIHPGSGAEQTCTAPPPEDLARIRQLLIDLE